MNKLDKAHAMAEKLTEDASDADVLMVLDAFREAWGLDNPATGTIAWLMMVFLPKWLERRR